MSETFIHPYMPSSAPEDRQAMLDALGIREVEELYGRVIPEALRWRGTMDLPQPIAGEPQLKQHVEGILRRNQSCGELSSFLGAGCYDHYVPAVCDEINTRAEFLTAYCGDTYSDHGKMQAIFEYTSLMGELLDMDVVSYTLYDGGQAVCSALRMAARAQAARGNGERRKVLLPATINPEILSQLRNYAKPAITLSTVACDEQTGRMDISDLRRQLAAGDVAAVFVENPAYLGFWEEGAAEIGRLAHEHGAFFVVQPEVASLGVAEPPSHYGADLVCGDIQPLGMHMQYGGGCAGFIASGDDPLFIQEYPTYLYSLCRTKEAGKYGWGRALNHRCSHGARENAREYFGTEAGLWAITAAVYLSLMGPQGMKELGELILQKRAYAVKTLSAVPNIAVNSLGGTGFQEFVVCYDGAGMTVEAVNRALLEKGILGGKDLSGDFPFLGQSALFAVTEKTGCDEIRRLAAALADITKEVR